MADVAGLIAQALKLIEKHPTRGLYERYRRYYDGNHDLGFASKNFERLFAHLFQEFALNYCEPVVDTLVDRLAVVGFHGEGKGARESLAVQANEIWSRNRMDLRSAQLMHEAVKLGDAYAIVWPDANGKAVIYPNRPDGIAVSYDDDTPGMIHMAVKVWKPGDDRYRLTIYMADHIYRFIAREASNSANLPKDASAFEALEVPGEDWPIVNPFDQVPVFPFAHRNGIDEYGVSELRAAIPVQDAVNKGVMDWIVAQEAIALPRRWATGIEVPKDEFGRVVAEFKSAWDAVWTTPDKDVTFGQFPGADVSGLLSGNSSLVGALAVITRTPAHYLIPTTGNWPSGESLKTAEAGLIAKADKAALRFGNAWEDVMRFAMRIDGIELSDEVRLSTQWEPTEPRSENDVATRTQTFVSAGAGLKQAAIAAGMSESDAEELAKVDLDDRQPLTDEDPEAADADGVAEGDDERELAAAGTARLAAR